MCCKEVAREECSSKGVVGRLMEYSSIHNNNVQSCVASCVPISTTRPTQSACE